MGLGAYPASGKNWLGMLGMHGTYEANMAMHDCDVMIVHRRALRRPHHRPRSTPSRRARRRSTSTSIRPRSTRTSTSTFRSSAMSANVLEDMIRVWKAEVDEARQEGAEGLVGADRRAGARATRLAYRPEQRRHHAAIRHRAALRADRDKDIYITTEVGQHQMWAAQFFRFEEPNRWMTSGGLGTMGYGLPAAVGVQIAHPDSAGHRHRRRRLGADDHAGDVDGGAVSSCRSRSSSSTTSTWAWCGSGSSCCTATACRIAIPRRCRISSSWPRPMAASASAREARRARRRDQGDDRGARSR